jgi:OCT family organic cation transporter-like MFS transporter 4/5
MILNMVSMSGNPFLNMFLLGLVEFPGFFVGMILCDRFGRRWSQVAAYLIAMMIQLACLITVLRKYIHFTTEIDI